MILKRRNEQVYCCGQLGNDLKNIEQLALGGLKVQGKDVETARKVVSEALALQEAGVFAIVFKERVNSAFPK